MKLNFLLLLSLLVSSTSFGQLIPINSSWVLTGATAAFLEGQSIENVTIEFMQDDVIEIHYDQAEEPKIEQSTWAQIDANNFKMSFDPTGDFFGGNCPDDTMFVEYDIVSNTLTMNVITGTCNVAGPILTGSGWLNPEIASIQPISEVHYSMFPNPAKNYFLINGSFSTNVSITVVNLVGEKMNCSMEVKTNESLEISTKNLKAGTYLVQILEENQLVQSLSLIVE